ncbi:unnamed protein product, partial [Adineta steineri]
MTHSKSVCFICNDETNKITYLCKGCSSEYCYEHLGEHRHELNQDFEILTNNYNQFQQRINEQKQNPQNSSLIKKINQWENESIEKIQQIAKEGVIVAGGNGSGDGLHQLSSPQGVAVDSCGHIYVVD